MLRHVVLFRWTPDATAAQKHAVTEALATLPGQIDQLRAFRFGPDQRLADGNWDFAVTADFDDRAGYLVYRDHPAHTEIITSFIAPIVDERAAVQFEVDA